MMIQGIGKPIMSFCTSSKDSTLSNKWKCLFFLLT
jgi:hypothetical protein